MSRIVVGVDGSDRALAALRWGVAEAALRGWPVVAVHAYSTPVAGLERIATSSPVLDLAPSAKAVLDEQLRRARHASDLPRDVPVDTVVAEGGAAAVLVETALPGDLLVVGARGHGGFAGLPLGSTSGHVVRHATCSVVVVP